MWAHDRQEERRLFEAFVDLVHERLGRDPGMHVYHYGAYEKSAMTQLMGAYATREDEVDRLLRRKVFVNLHTVVRQGLRAGVPSYSLKEVEALAEFSRQADVRSGTARHLAYEAFMETRAEERLAEIAPTTTRTVARRWRCVIGSSRSGRRARRGRQRLP